MPTTGRGALRTKYKELSGAGTPDGGQKAVLKIGLPGKAKALVKGKGVNLPDTLSPMLPLPVTVQLVKRRKQRLLQGGLRLG